MKVNATASSEIEPSCRLFVHKMIRSSASRLLKLSIIEFLDHPDKDIQNVKRDLEKTFIFDKNLRPNYVFDCVELSMKNARYKYHKHWLDTQKGEKHEDCRQRYFPQLVKYWWTKEAEKELREHGAEKAAAQEKQLAIREERRNSSIVDEDSWNVSFLPLTSTQRRMFLGYFLTLNFDLTYFINIHYSFPI